MVTTRSTKKKGPPVRGALKKAVSAAHAASSADPRPLEGYTSILTGYAVLTAGLAFGLRNKRGRLRAMGPMDLLLYGLATEHLSRVVTKDSITSGFRFPFTRFKESAGEGEVNEEVIGHGHRHAIGELLSCPFCVAQWVATGLVAGSVGAPALTTAVISISAAARVSDYFQLLYGQLRKDQ